MNSDQIHLENETYYMCNVAQQRLINVAHLMHKTSTSRNEFKEGGGRQSAMICRVCAFVHLIFPRVVIIVKG